MGSLATAPAPAIDTPPVAVCAGRVELRYDVLSDVSTGRLAGLQADLVWQHPAWGALPADDVWAAAARQDRHRPLRRWLLEQACRHTAGLSGTVSVAVRLPAELTDAGALVDDVADALTAAGLPADRLTLAFPEELLPGASSDLPAALRALRGSGVRLALTGDDAGTTPELPRGISGAAAEVRVRTVVADVESPTVPARVGAPELPAMTGPLLPGGLSAAQVAALLRGQASGVSSSTSRRSPGVS